MTSHEARKTLCLRQLTGILAVLFLGSYIVNADDKKPAPAKPAAPHPAAAPAKSAPAAAKGGAPSSGTPKGPTTAGTPKGPTTSSPKGPTTSSPKGPTTGTPHATGTTPGATRGTGTTAGTPKGPGTGAPRGTGTTAGSPRSTPGGTTRGTNSPGGSRPLPQGHTVAHTARGDSVTKRPNGRPADVHMASRGMDVHHGLSGNRRVEVVRGDRRIVAERGGRGYVQRPYRYGGREYAHRTYYYHGRAYDHFYHGYPYHGVYVQMYTPAFYYRPAFYGWAYNPWVAPVPYAWGWAGNPWYGYYGAYFTPYPVYPSASVWLTDYMISTTLMAAYQARVDAAAAAAGAAAAQAQPAPAPDAVALTPEVKNMIAEEVKRQLAVANAESQAAAQNAAPNPALSGVQAMLSDNVQHVFVAGRDVDVVDAAGAECAISEGDALQLKGPPAAGATAATLVVLSSKGGPECKGGATVTVQVADLQDMQNHMRETIDQGMSELQTKQGKGGLPTLPASAAAQPVKAAFAADAPGPEQDVATQISQQTQEADKAEQEVLSQALQGPGSAPAAGSDQGTAAPPAEFDPLGKSVDEITAMFGQPKNILDLGPKKIFVYKDMKVTFKDGKVTDVQ